MEAKTTKGSTTLFYHKQRKVYQGLHLRTANLLRKQHLNKVVKGLLLTTAAAWLISLCTSVVCRTRSVSKRSTLICTA
jgi:hypothetical protein